MDLTLEELTALRRLLEDDLEVAQVHREQVLEEDSDADFENALEIVDHEALLRTIHKKVSDSIKGGG